MSVTGLGFGRTALGGLAAAACAALSALPAQAGPVYYVTTGQAGAQTQIDVNHATTVSFRAASTWDLGGGNLTMKGGSGTTASVNLSLYQGTGNAGPLVASVVLSKGTFCTLHGGNCQSFNTTPVYFSSPYTVTAGNDYFLALTSAAGDQQSTAYFIKGLNSLSILDGTGAALPGQTVGTTPTPTPTPAPVSVPEPASLVLLGLGLAGLGFARLHWTATKPRSLQRHAPDAQT